MAPKQSKKKLSEAQLFIKTFICPICGVAPTREDNFMKHIKSATCSSIQERNTSSRSQQVKQVNPDFSISPDFEGIFDRPSLKKLTRLAKELELPPCYDLLNLGNRYVFMNNYKSYFLMAVNFSLSTFLMDTPKDTINHPKNLIVIDSPSGSIMDALTLLVSLFLFMI